MIPAPFIIRTDATGAVVRAERLMFIHPRNIAGQNKRAVARKRQPS